MQSAGEDEVLQRGACTWTPRLQSRLELLLERYPHCAAEPLSLRWERIARDLPGITPKQVFSRVQKYFIKLDQAGLPVPGIVPNYKARVSFPFSLMACRPTRATGSTRACAPSRRPLSAPSP